MRKLILPFLLVILFSSFSPSEKELKTAIGILSKALSSKELCLQKVGQQEYYTIYKGEKPVGRLFYRQLTPKGETFTYFIALDGNGNIIQLHITDYPSQYGVRMTTRSWLNQFIGKSPHSGTFANDIDAISGATLSVNALVKDIQSLSNSK